MSALSSPKLKGTEIQTYSGRAVDVLNLQPDDVRLVDVAHALSMKCRFTGHCKEFYSVAHHSLLVSYLVTPDQALAGLLHDACEAYLPDVAAPVKPHLPGFAELEARVQAAILDRLDVTGKGGHSPDVDQVDKTLVWREMQWLLPATKQLWRDKMDRAQHLRHNVWQLRVTDRFDPHTLSPSWDPRTVRDAFVNRYLELV